MTSSPPHQQPHSLRQSSRRSDRAVTPVSPELQCMHSRRSPLNSLSLAVPPPSDISLADIRTPMLASSLLARERWCPPPLASIFVCVHRFQSANLNDSCPPLPHHPHPSTPLCLSLTTHTLPLPSASPSPPTHSHSPLPLPHHPHPPTPFCLSLTTHTLPLPSASPSPPTPSHSPLPLPHHPHPPTPLSLSLTTHTLPLPSPSPYTNICQRSILKTKPTSWD
ncbi:hypothetical protein BLNAU_8702 [Blattamonas nauphoetae]|uniref:Uncharacterized protein n=1 Tax=Blattamonas nauphoetae TaxID=2049346 RepID=A0ABQ9XXY1_9EUKA|nr:hypothetical protein BLNAU_8702 [Blattamonas nauphoetae]